MVLQRQQAEDSVSVDVTVGVSLSVSHGQLHGHGQVARRNKGYSLTPCYHQYLYRSTRDTVPQSQGSRWGLPKRILEGAANHVVADHSM